MNEFTVDTLASDDPYDLSGELPQSNDNALQSQEQGEFLINTKLLPVMRQHFERYIDLLLFDERRLLRIAIGSVKKDGLQELQMHIGKRFDFFKRTVKLGQLLGLISHNDAELHNDRLDQELKILLERFDWQSKILTSPDSIDFRTKRKMRLKYAFSDMMS